MTDQQKTFIKLANALLNSDQGISEEGYHALIDMAESLQDDFDWPEWHAIKQTVDATDGQFYLPEGWSHD